MAKFNIVGVQHRYGKSRSGRDYDFYALHCVTARAMRPTDGVGNAVAEITIGAADGIFIDNRIPAPGEVWEIEFSRNGRVEDAYPAE